jgi:Glycosyl hydrolases family 6
MTLFHDLDEFVTERLTRDHQTEVAPVVVLHKTVGILRTVALFSGARRRMVAVIAASVLLVLVALGYLLLRALTSSRLQNDEQAYEKWVSGFAAGLGDRPAVVILEPDALAGLNSCPDSAQQQARLQMLSYAVKTLQTNSDQVYLDAGHSNWVPAGQMAARLRSADIAQAYGFAVNVSNYDATDREIGYATKLDRDLGMAKRFVVDTSRNGTGRAGGGVDPVGGSISRALPGAGGGAPTSRLFTDPESLAASWVRTHPGDPRAREIAQRIANQPTAKWFGAWSGDITAAVAAYAVAASSEHKVPVLVAYDIPQLGCGGSSAAGARLWCNVPGRQLGSAPRVLDDRGDLGLWIKAPGESDGDCGAGAGTQAGKFSPRLATELITGRS